MQYYRIMGLDYGKARIGIAFTDLSRTISTADRIYKCCGDVAKDLDFLAKLAKDKEVKEIVIGLPLNADGSESEMSQEVKNFGEKMAEVSQTKVFYQDERYTSFEAEEYLKEAKMKWEKRKEVLDMVSAQIILQNYLDERK